MLSYCCIIPDSLSYINKLESDHGGTEHFSLRVGAALQDVVQAGVQAEREELTVGAAMCAEILM